VEHSAGLGLQFLTVMSWLPTILAFAIVLLGCAGPANRTGLPATETETGRKIYFVKCAKCHKFYDPTQYSDVEWKMWMGKMKRKAKLSDEQEMMLSTFIDTTLRGGGKSQKSSMPPSVPK